jgi:hypothetical protein
MKQATLFSSEVVDVKFPIESLTEKVLERKWVEITGRSVAEFRKLPKTPRYSAKNPPKVNLTILRKQASPDDQEDIELAAQIIDMGLRDNLEFLEEEVAEIGPKYVHGCIFCHYISHYFHDVTIHMALQHYFQMIYQGQIYPYVVFSPDGTIP